MPRLGELLVSIGACEPEAIAKALQNQAFFGARLGTNLLYLGAVHEAQLADALERLHGIQTLSGDVAVDPKAVAVMPRRLVERYEAVPYAVSDRNLTVLVSDPRDVRALDDIAFATGRKVRPLVIPEARLWALMWKLYGIRRELRGIEIERGGERPGRVEGSELVVEAATIAADLMSEDEFIALYQR